MGQTRVCGPVARGPAARAGEGDADPAGVGPAGGSRFAAEARPAAPEAAAPAPHLHVGHEALLDPPAVFIDLVQELQLIVVVATHGGGEGGGSPRLGSEREAAALSTGSA